MANIIETLETENRSKTARFIPEFTAGDTVVVYVKVVEGTRERIKPLKALLLPNATAALNLLLPYVKFHTAKV